MDGEEDLNTRVHLLYDMAYWLMSLNKDQSKKQGGIFIHFKDHKGKLDQAVQKMLSDLKKFGLPNVKNFKVDQVVKGYGEQVC